MSIKRRAREMCVRDLRDWLAWLWLAFSGCGEGKENDDDDERWRRDEIAKSMQKEPHLSSKVFLPTWFSSHKKILLNIRWRIAYEIRFLGNLSNVIHRGRSDYPEYEKNVYFWTPLLVQSPSAGPFSNDFPQKQHPRWFISFKLFCSTRSRESFRFMLWRNEFQLKHGTSSIERRARRSKVPSIDSSNPPCVNGEFVIVSSAAGRWWIYDAKSERRASFIFNSFSPFVFFYLRHHQPPRIGDLEPHPTLVLINKSI